MTLDELFRLLLRRWWLLLALALVGGFVGYLVESSRPDTYEAAGRVVIGPALEDTDNIIESTGSLARSTLPQTLAEMATGSEVRRTAAEQLDEPITDDYEVASVVIPETSVVEIDVTGPDRGATIQIASAVMEETELVFEGLYPIYDVVLLDEPDGPEGPVSPNPQLGAVVGTVVGMLLGAVIAAVAGGRRPEQPQHHRPRAQPEYHQREPEQHRAEREHHQPQAEHEPEPELHQPQADAEPEPEPEHHQPQADAEPEPEPEPEHHQPQADAEPEHHQPQAEHEPEPEPEPEPGRPERRSVDAAEGDHRDETRSGNQDDDRDRSEEPEPERHPAHAAAAATTPRGDAGGDRRSAMARRTGDLDDAPLWERESWSKAQASPHQPIGDPFDVADAFDGEPAWLRDGNGGPSFRSA